MYHVTTFITSFSAYITCNICVNKLTILLEASHRHTH